MKRDTANQDNSVAVSGAVIENVFGDNLQFAISVAKPAAAPQRESFASDEPIDEVTERAIFEDLLLAESRLQDTDPDETLWSDPAATGEHNQDESATAAVAIVLGETPHWRPL